MLKKKGMIVVPHEPEWVEAHPIIVYSKICWDNQEQWVGNEVKCPHVVFVLSLYEPQKGYWFCPEKAAGDLHIVVIIAIYTQCIWEMDHQKWPQDPCLASNTTKAFESQSIQTLKSKKHA